MSDLANDKAYQAALNHLHDLWPLSTETQQQIFLANREPMSALFSEMGLGQRGLPFALIQANMFAPEAISGDKICLRFPYSAPNAWEKLLLQIANIGLLERTPNRQVFLLNEAGAEAYATFLEAFDAELVAISGRLAPQISSDSLEDIAALLKKVVQNAVTVTPAAKSPHLAQFWAKQRAADSCALHRIDYYLDCLNAFRDDVHIASFAQHNLPGYAWELFTFIWQGQLTDIVDLADRLGPFRGYDARAYHQGLMQLVGLGWIKLEENAPYKLTEEGLARRIEAESRTDQDFYSPWLCLKPKETDQLRKGLQALKAALASG